MCVDAPAIDVSLPASVPPAVESRDISTLKMEIATLNREVNIRVIRACVQTRLLRFAVYRQAHPGLVGGINTELLRTSQTQCKRTDVILCERPTNV